jgi:hypothetical protein
MPIRRLALAFALLASAQAVAQPVYKDRERFDAMSPGAAGRGPVGAEPPPFADPRVFRPPVLGPHGRPVNGGPGYVGSDYGLGKPAYTGLGTRPDWGRSE